MSAVAPVSQSLLILRPGALGDVILALPAVAALQLSGPPRKITWVGYPQHLSWLQGSPYLHHWRSIDESMFQALFCPGEEAHLDSWLASFSQVVAWMNDPHGDIRKRLQRLCPQQHIAAPPFPDPAAGVHAGEHLLASLAPWLPSWPQTIQLQRPAEWLSAQALAADRLPLPAEYAVFHPGSGSRKKNWPLPRFLELGEWLERELALPVIWITGYADEELARQLAGHRVIPPGRHWRQPDLTEAIGLLTRARVYVGNDSGISHLAALCGTPTATVFTVTDPQTWKPRGLHVTAWRAGPNEDANVSLQGLRHFLSSRR